MRKSEIVTKSNIKELASFIKEAIEGLENETATCYRFKLEDDRLAIFIGWEDGFSREDKEIYQGGSARDDMQEIVYAICCGVKVNNQAFWADYEYLDFPWDKRDGEICDMGISLSKCDNLEIIAKDLLVMYVNAINLLNRGILVYE